MWILFKGLIILSSIFTLRSVSIDPFWKPKEGIFIVLGFVFLASCWLTKKSNRYVFESKWLSMILIYVALLFGWNFIWPYITNIETLNLIDKSVNATYSIPLVLPSIWYTVLPTLNVILALLLVYHLVEHTDSITLRWVGIIKVVCWVGFGFAVYSILQFLGYDQIFPKITLSTRWEEIMKEYRMFTFLGNKMLSSNIIAAITPLFMIFRTKKYYLSMVICLIALCLFKSAFNLGVAIFGISVILFLQGKGKVAIGTLLIALALVVVFKRHTNIPELVKGFYLNGRVDMAKRVIMESKGSVLTGDGLGSMFRDFSPTEASWKRFHSSHNMLIDIYKEMGLIGIVLVFGYLFNLFKRLYILFLNNRQSIFLVGLCGGFLSYLMMSMGSFPHRIAPLALLGIIYMAGIEVHLSKRRIV